MPHPLMAALALLTALSACQCQRSMQCSKASGDAEACRAMSDTCYTLGGASCPGTACGRCRADETTKTCVRESDWASRCPSDTRIFQGGVVGDLNLYTWKRAKVSDFAKTLSHTQLSRDDFEKLSPVDRNELCASGPEDSCVLEWDPKRDISLCVVPEAACQACPYVEVPIKCQAKNGCNGVICL
jgi:hypothetical protein